MYKIRKILVKHAIQSRGSGGSNSVEKPISKYFSLSPLTNINNSVYFDALNEKLNDNSIKNIAIIGPYGSGKSSVIDSYILADTKNKYLRVSLANFCEAKGEITEEDEKKIEEQILQQLFYQLSNDDIPLSGFKKINHIDKKAQQKKVIAIIFWLFSLLLMPRLFKLLNDNLQTISSIGFIGLWNQITWIDSVFNVITLVVFCIGLFYILSEIIRIKQKGQLKKVTMKSAQVELSEDSALNKYIDELIYFFEATDKNIVVIEDLDRFNSVKLFSKLREVNFLINNSPKVSQTIKFVYAIKDDIFTNNFNRTKFFDFILPIVPIINTTNSGDKLREMLDGKPPLTSNYINDISLYLHDMRLLKNIVNEYQIYNGVINNDYKKRSIFLFSIILYKNIFTNEFSKEHYREGLLYKIFNEKKEIILNNVLKDKIEKQTNLENHKNEILSETIENETKLREEYIIEIQKYYYPIKSICNNSILDILIEENFNMLLTDPRVEVYYEYSSLNYRVNEKTIDFKEIQRKVNQEKTYTERLDLIKQRNSKNLLKINLEIRKNEEEIERLKRKKLSELIKQYKDNSWEDSIFNIDKGKTGNEDKKLSQEEKLLILLLRKGYIEENYPLYISYFYEGALSYKDFEFLLNVKNKEDGNFNTKLSSVDELISRISEDEYEYKATLNKDIISNLIKSPNYKNDNRLELLFKQFEYIDGAFEEYILPLIYYLKDTQKELQRFIELMVVKYYPTIWKNIEQQNFEDSKKDELLKRFLFLSEDNIRSMNANSDDRLKKYLTINSDFIEVFDTPSEIGNVIKLIKALNIKFQNLIFKRYDNNQIFNHIYQNKNYELNKNMLYQMLSYKYTVSQDDFDRLFYKQNYTSIYNSNYDVLNEYVAENFTTYLEEIYLKLESEQNESEEAFFSFIEMLEEKEDVDTLLYSVLGKISTQIIDINKFGKEDKWSLLFDRNCVEPNWNNLICYFKHKDNSINKTITNWLNNESVCKTITQHKLKFDENSAEKDITISLQTNIIENDKLSNKAYEWLLISFPYIYPDINLEELSKEKISKLIEFENIAFNTQHYEQILKLGLKENLLHFTINNLETYLKDYKDYDFSLELHKKLLDSEKVSYDDKYSLIDKISIENISDSEIANLISSLLITMDNESIDNKKIIHVIKQCRSQRNKLKLLNKYKFDFSEIDSILDNIGGVYKKASILRNKPVWENNELNLSIAQKLLGLGYLHSVKINQKGEIKIVVRYS
jgi:hypothetical protein